MAATKSEISSWFDEGVRQKASHMIVVCDSYDHDDYPVFITTDEAGAKAKVQEYADGKHSMQRVMEIYSLSLPKSPQMEAPRSFNYAVASGARTRLMTRHGEVEVAFTDGYGFGDKLMDGVIFEYRVVDGEVRATGVRKEDEAYFEQFNRDFWLKKADRYLKDIPDSLWSGKNRVTVVKE